MLLHLKPALPLPFLPLAFLLVLWIFVISPKPSFAKPYTDIQTFRSSTYSVVPDHGHYPPVFRVSQTITLPHNASVQPTTSAWYQFTFHLNNKPKQNLALFLPLINMNASIYLNHQLIAASGSFNEPMSRFWHTPVLFYLPSTSLRHGDNTLHIRLKASLPNNLTQLGKVYWGGIEQVYNMYAQAYFANYTIHLMALSAALFLSFITFYLWVLRRAGEYLYFSLAALTWAISSFNIVIHNPPFSTHLWEWLIQSTLSWMPLCILFFIRSVFMLKHRLFEKILILIFLALTLLLLFIPHIYFFPVTNLWHFFSLSIGIYAVYIVFYHCIKYQDKTALILSLSFVLVALFATHDYLIIIQVIGSENRFLLDYAMPLLFLAIAIVLIHRFVDATQGLEQRVQSAEAEIKESYAVISALEAAEAVDAERIRIFGDLHDDLGAKLLSLVYKSETNEQKKLAKQAMDGLREIVKRSPLDNQLTMNPIALWLSESQKRLAEQHIPLEWHQHRISKHFIPPFETTNILREAINNAIKHGDGKRICIRLQLRFGLFIMSVCNTGQAFSKNSLQGYGRKSMLRRIQHMNGKIRWRSGKKGGCHVIWAIPLADHP